MSHADIYPEDAARYTRDEQRSKIIDREERAPYASLYGEYQDNMMAIVLAARSLKIDALTTSYMVSAYVAAPDEKTSFLRYHYSGGTYQAHRETEVKSNAKRELIATGYLNPVDTSFGDKFKPHAPETFAEKRQWWLDQIKEGVFNREIALGQQAGLAWTPQKHECGM